MAKVKLKPTGDSLADVERQRVERERQIKLDRKADAEKVVLAYAVSHDLPDEDRDEIIAALGLHEDDTLGGSILPPMLN